MWSKAVCRSDINKVRSTFRLELVSLYHLRVVRILLRCLLLSILSESFDRGFVRTMPVQTRGALIKLISYFHLSPLVAELYLLRPLFPRVLHPFCDAHAAFLVGLV